jgi:Icc-related predicted phosphoesterase
MRVHVASDLHINFDTGYDTLQLPGGDVLLLCGDVMEAGHIRVAQNTGKHQSVVDMYKKFCDTQLTKYHTVLYVFGNHEYYNHDFATARERIEPFLPPNVTILQNSYVKLDDYLIWGATMWTDHDRGNPVVRQAVSSGMNDFRVIKHEPSKLVNSGRGEFYTHRFSVWDAEHEHKHSRARLEEFLLAYPQHKTVVMTHHAPHYESIAGEYRDHVYGYLNHAYYSDLSELMLDNPQLKLWCHGHVHNMNDYEIGGCRVISNPRGYARYERQAERFEKASSKIWIELD